jgi:hypothetical protein
MLIRGDRLNARQREQVLAAFVYRWTTENPQRMAAYRKCHLCDIRKPYVNATSASGHTHPTIPLISDQQWLDEHSFHFIADGSRLSARHKWAEPACMAA